MGDDDDVVYDGWWWERFPMAFVTVYILIIDFDFDFFLSFPGEKKGCISPRNAICVFSRAVYAHIWK